MVSCVRLRRHLIAFVMRKEFIIDGVTCTSGTQGFEVLFVRLINAAAFDVNQGLQIESVGLFERVLEFVGDQFRIFNMRGKQIDRDADSPVGVVFRNGKRATTAVWRRQCYYHAN